MPSLRASALLHSSTDGCACREGTGLARRLILLAGLVVGFWLLASIVHGARASAAPIPGTSANRTSAAIGSHLPNPIRSARSLERTARTALEQAQTSRPVRQEVADLATAARGSVRAATGTLHAAAGTLATTNHLPSSTVVHILSPVAHVVLPSAESAAGPGFTATSAVTSASLASASSQAAARTATTTNRNATTANRNATPTEQSLTGSRTGPQRPGRTPAPADCVLASGAVGASQTSGGAAAEALPTTVSGPTPFLLSAPNSFSAAMLRTAIERFSVSPD